ncbi:MAG: twin-arginine translocase subunit TatB [Gammaproteobacteria bacterium]|nr:MAG: twin-arginine translocase subunit TatB [Gammaproteobacteria bacterium]
MFDIGFWEITVILIIALLVVGPERLPGLMRTVGLWVGKTRRFIASVKADIDRELQADELRQMLDQQAQEVARLKQMMNDHVPLSIEESEEKPAAKAPHEHS